MEGFLSTLIVVLVIAAVIAAYIWYLKRSGYLDDFEDADEAITNSDLFKAQIKSQEDRAAQICGRYARP